MSYRLAIFDLDGTILDTLEDLKESTNAALAANGYPERTLEEVRCFVGNGIGKLIERAVPKGTSKEATKKTLESFKVHYGIHCADHTKPYDGIIKLLEDLRKCGIQTAVVSNKADFAVQELCSQYFPKVFDFVVGERDGIRRKPCPDSVFEVLKTLKKTAAEAVYIGDSDVDVDTAKEAGEDAAAFWNETFSDRRADGNACGTGDGLLPGTGIAGNRKLPSGAAGPSERTQMSSLWKNHRAEWKRCAEKILFG